LTEPLIGRGPPPRAGPPSRLPLDPPPLSGAAYTALVREHEVATEVAAENAWGIDPDLFSVYAQARPGKTGAELERRIDAVLEELGAEPVPPDELAKAKNQLRAGLVRGLKTVSGKANQIGFFEVVFGDHRALLALEAGWDRVTAEDVARVARERLVPARRTVVTLVPLTGREEGRR